MHWRECKSKKILRDAQDDKGIYNDEIPFYFSTGFFFPADSFSTVLINRSLRVFSCLADSIQITYSFLLE
jgi:hypothetical protein